MRCMIEFLVFIQIFYACLWVFHSFQEISSLSVESCVGEFLIVTVFEIKIEEVPSFLKREEEFRFLAVIPEGLDGMPFSNRAVLCARYSDEEYFQIRCQGSKEIYHERYGRYNIHKIWRDDILPCRIYLRHWYNSPFRELFLPLQFNVYPSILLNLYLSFATLLSFKMLATLNKKSVQKNDKQLELKYLLSVSKWMYQVDKTIVLKT
ncbi:uncharacterized protein LOC144554527 isoform X1 [Carex rostrata]